MKFYRYDTASKSDCDPDMETSTYYGQELGLTEFVLAKETPKCYRIAYEWDKSFNHTKLIRKNSIKKFAHLIKEKAAESFLARKQRQVKILREQLKRAEDALNIARNLNQELNIPVN